MPYPIIIIEGPDTCGKSTLAAAIAKRTNGYVMHQTYRFKDRMVKYHTAVWELAKKRAKKQVVIIDRWWPSEVVYANVYRGGPAHPTYWRCLDRDAARYGAAYIWCIPRRLEMYQSFLRRNYGKQEQMYDMESMDRVWEVYKDLLYWTMRRTSRDLFYNYDVTMDVHGADMFAKYVVTNVSSWFKSADKDLLKLMFSSDREYSGNLKNPKQVIVVDQPYTRFNHMVGLTDPCERINLWMDDNDVHENRTAFSTPEALPKLMQFWQSFRLQQPEIMELGTDETDNSK